VEAQIKKHRTGTTRELPSLTHADLRKTRVPSASGAVESRPGPAGSGPYRNPGLGGQERKIVGKQHFGCSVPSPIRCETSAFLDGHDAFRREDGNCACVGLGVDA
jgi:hypothetical protein